MEEAQQLAFVAPFDGEDVGWHVTDVGEDGGRVALAPHVRAAALQARLDAVVGPSGWSFAVRPWGDGALAAELRVGDVTRSAVVAVRGRPGLAEDRGEAATGAAWTAAAAGFGVRVPVTVVGDAWVDADPATGEPLYPPETDDVPPDAAADLRADPGAAPAEASEGADAGEDDVARGARPLAATAAAGDAVDAKPEVQRWIDKLVDRLSEEGLGVEAARLVAQAGGYGGDVEASRALYASLRDLLVERGRGA
ncbi:MAG: hypothetical protein RI554_05960 [Trueperaceae bacterium]|nr:hypothetical protein [Trueperaceae bacterium]